MTITSQHATNNAGCSPCTPEAHHRADLVKAQLRVRHWDVDFSVTERAGNGRWSLIIQWSGLPNTSEIRGVLKSLESNLDCVSVAPDNGKFLRTLVYIGTL